MQLLSKTCVTTPENGECDKIVVRVEKGEHRDFMLTTIILLEPMILDVEDGTEPGEYSILFKGKCDAYKAKIQKYWPKFAAIIYN